MFDKIKKRDQGSEKGKKKNPGYDDYKLYLIGFRGSVNMKLDELNSNVY